MAKIENQLKARIAESVKKLYGIDDASMVQVEIPKNTDYGDYSTNMAMQLPRILHRSPKEISAELAEELSKQTDLIETVEVAGPGFINFRLKKSILADIINAALKEGEHFGKNESGKGKNILVEYVSANPTGDLHLGHARGAVWGDAICRLLNASGWNCLREYYINDAGAQMLNLGKSVYARYAECFGVEVEIPEDGYYGEDVKQIGHDLAEELGDVWLNKEEGRIEYFRDRGYERELEKIKRDLKDFNCEFDSWISERSLYDRGLVDETVEKMKEMGLTYEKDSALWFTTTKFGDDKDRVLVKSDGSLTYMTPDIANHLDKFARGYEKLVDLWGADHHSYVTRMKAAMAAFGHDWNDLEVDIIQMVRLVENGEEVKMSKRSGNAITIRELVADVGLDAARYFFVSRDVASHLDFDLGLARKKTSENPIYYIQYAHARTCGVFKNAPEVKPQEHYELLKEQKEVDLLKLLNDYTDLVAESALLRAPHRISNYLMKLASAFHSYYGSYKFVDPEHPELMNERLALVKAVQITLENALSLLGLSAPQEM
ncbi:MAG: arginine--tRNA ligase [Peptoniphilaceae bacterium]|nr:arginine--tRNA ligase [Peptoniphilaceae bacterium]